MIFRRRKRRKVAPAAEELDPDLAGGNRDQSEDAGAAPPDGPREAEGGDGPAVEPSPEGPSETGEDSAKTPGLFASTRAALAPVRKRHVFVASLGLMGIAVGGILLFSAASFWWTSQPSFCNRCHVMKPYVAAWEQSSHREVSCESCHLTPGFFGFLGGKISGLQVVMNYIRGEYEDYSFNASVSNASCLQCHRSILEGNIHSADTGITVSHSNIIGLGGKCMNCHSTVAHGGQVAFGSQTHPTMQTCLRCHNDQIAPLDCDLCHTGREPPMEGPDTTSPGSETSLGSDTGS